MSLVTREVDGLGRLMAVPAGPSLFSGKSEQRLTQAGSAVDSLP